MADNIAIKRQSSGAKPTSPDEADDTKLDHPKLPHQLAIQSEDRSADRLTFFGFAPLRKRLSGHAVDFLLNHRRFAKPEDPPEVVGKKNVIIMFTIYTEIEDCLVQVPFGHKVDKAKPLGLLQQLLEITYMKGPRAYTFALAILKAYTNSRYEQIVHHLFRNQLPPEPETAMDKVLLSVVDRRLVFMFTREPLHTMPVSSPHSRLQHHRLKLERLLSNEAEVENIFTAFIPMVPPVNQKPWPKPWHIKPWLREQQDIFRKKFNLPQTPGASDGVDLAENRGTATAQPKEDHINSRMLDIPAMKPSASEIACGICLYKLGTRLACNYISVHQAPEVVQPFTNSILSLIEGFAEYLEDYLAAHPPDSVGQHRAAYEGDFAAATMIVHPAEAHKVLQTGVEMVLFGLNSENLSLLQWSWVATKVQQGKTAIENACGESLARSLPREFKTSS